MLSGSEPHDGNRESRPIMECLAEAQAAVRNRRGPVPPVGVEVFRSALLTVDLTTDSGPDSDFLLEVRPSRVALPTPPRASGSTSDQGLPELAARAARVDQAETAPGTPPGTPPDPAAEATSGSAGPPERRVTDPGFDRDETARVEHLDQVAVDLGQESAGADGEVSHAAAGERLRAGLARLLSTDPTSAAGADLAHELSMIQDLQSFLQAASVQRMAALTVPGVAGDPTRLVERRMAENSMVASLSGEQLQVIRDGETVLVAEQLAAAQVGATLMIAPSTAARRVQEAVEFVEQLPLTVTALTDGHIDPQRARTLAERSRVLTADQRAELEWQVLPEASSHTPTQWRNLVDAAVLALDPDAAEQRRKDAVERRRLRMERLEDGIGRFMAELPAHQAQLAWDLFDAVADALKGMDDRTADQRRADAFVTIIEMLASGRSVTVADILGHPHVTRHDTCHRPEHPADLTCDHCQTSFCAADLGAEGVTEPQGPTQQPDPGAQDPVARDPQPGCEHAGATDANTEGSDPSEEPILPDPSAESSSAGTTDRDPEADASSKGLSDVIDEPDRPETAAVVDSELVGRSEDSIGGAEHARGPETEAAGTPDETVLESCFEIEPSVGDVAESASAGAALPDVPPNPVLPTDEGCAPTCGCGRWKLPTRQGRDTHTTIVVTLDALAGLVQDPAQLNGHGIVTAEYARTLADAARSVSFLVTDETGRPLALGDRVYRPSQRLRDKVTSAYSTCIFTGCHRPVDRSDLDHRKEFDRDDPAKGGPTDQQNLQPLCRHHHRLKTLCGWSYQPAESGGVRGAAIPAAFVFRSPLGIETVSRVDHVVRARRVTPAPF